MIEISALRLYLLAGLLTHKAVWEIMKRQSPAQRISKAGSLPTRLVRLVKVGILLGILVQTMLPEVLPLSSDPAPWRAVGVVLFSVGLATALLGRIQLGSNWSDIEIAVVRREHRVVSRGIYGFVRHPIYSGDLLLLLGLQLALHSWLVVLPILLIPVVARQAVREERDLAAKLPGYDLYCRRTKRFIPFLA